MFCYPFLQSFNVFCCLFVVCTCKFKFTSTVVVYLFSWNGYSWLSENKCRMWLPVSTSRKSARKGAVCCRWIYFLVCRNIPLRIFFTDLAPGICWSVRHCIISMDQFKSISYQKSNFKNTYLRLCNLGNFEYSTHRSEHMKFIQNKKYIEQI